VTVSRRGPSTTNHDPSADGERGVRAPGSWLARTSPAAEVQGRAWRPSTIRGIAAGRLRYAVVDEVFGELAELSLSGWPVLDALGRLRFPEAATAHLEVDASRMRTFLRRHRMPRKEAGRFLRTGDAFAFVVRRRALEAFLFGARSSTASTDERRKMLEPANWGWLVPPVYDVSLEAREAAKLSYNAALTGPLSPPALQER
jgi:hypothetical protein